MPVTISQTWYRFDELDGAAKAKAARVLAEYLEYDGWYDVKRSREMASLDAFMASIACEYSAADGDLDWIRPRSGGDTLVVASLLSKVGDLDWIRPRSGGDYWPFASAYVDDDELDPDEVMTLPCDGDDDDALVFALPIEAQSDGHPVGNVLAKSWAEMHDSAISEATETNRRLAGMAQDGAAGVQLASDLRLSMLALGARWRTWLARNVRKALDMIENDCDPLNDAYLDPEYVSNVLCSDDRYLFSADGRRLYAATNQDA